MKQICYNREDKGDNMIKMSMTAKTLLFIASIIACGYFDYFYVPGNTQTYDTLVNTINGKESVANAEFHNALKSYVWFIPGLLGLIFYVPPVIKTIRNEVTGECEGFESN